MRFILPAVAVLAALASAGPAAAQRASDPDLRCFIVMAAINDKAQDPAMKSAMQMGAFYYLGKVKGREPGLALEPAFEALLPQIDEPMLRAEAARCSAEMAGLSQETAALSAAMRAIEQKK